MSELDLIRKINAVEKKVNGLIPLERPVGVSGTSVLEGPGIDVVAAPGTVTVGVGLDSILVAHAVGPASEYAATVAGLTAALAAVVDYDVLYISHDVDIGTVGVDTWTFPAKNFSIVGVWPVDYTTDLPKATIGGNIVTTNASTIVNLKNLYINGRLSLVNGGLAYLEDTKIDPVGSAEHESIIIRSNGLTLRRCTLTGYFDGTRATAIQVTHAGTPFCEDCKFILPGGATSFFIYFDNVLMGPEAYFRNCMLSYANPGDSVHLTNANTLAWAYDVVGAMAEGMQETDCDRSAFDVTLFAAYHASDIAAAALLRHLPAPGTAGHIARDNGMNWVSVNPAAYSPFAPTARGDLIAADVTPAWSRLALGGAAGSFLRRDATDPVWSTLVMPDAAVKGDVLVATAANTIGSVVDVAAGQPLLSGGIGLVPAYAGWTLSGTAGQTYTFPVAGGTLVTTARTLTAGAGLTGGGDLSADRTFDVGAGTMITVNTNDVAITVGAAQYQYIVSGANPFPAGWSTGYLNIAATKTLTLATESAKITGGGASCNLTLPNASTIVTGGGTLALGGYTVTVPATGTAALLEIANIFTLGAVFNESGADSDLRIDGVTGAGLFLCDAGNNRVAIGGAPTPTNSFKLGVLYADTNTSGIRAAIASQIIGNPGGASSAAYEGCIFESGTQTGNAQNLTNGSALVGVSGSLVHRGSGTVTGGALFLAAGASSSGGGTVTNLYGFRCVDLTVGTNNYGIHLAVSSGTNKWNVYAPGTASNYFAGNVLIGTLTDGMTANGSLAIAQDLAHQGTKIGFYNTAPIAKQTGVAVTAAGIHAACVALGLFSA
jgi:hypothetical protein